VKENELVNTSCHLFGARKYNQTGT